jgi:flagellar biosynthetic protein FliR
MNQLELIVAMFAFAALRYLPVLAIPALSPLSWAPGIVRLTLLFALAWLTVLASPTLPTQAAWQSGGGLLLACLGELMIGLTFGLAILLPQAGIGMSARLADTQAGLSAATLFNPNGQHEPESMFGTIVLLAATVLFFALDLHLVLFQVLTTSVQAAPLGALAMHLDMEGFFALVTSSFLLGLAVVAPVILGLFVVDLGVAYATRSMPQANVYFLALPLKVALALVLLAATLAFAPVLIGRLFQDAFARLPAVFGA